MCTIFTHAALGLGAGRICSTARRPRGFWILAATLPVLPDADGILLSLGVPYAHMFGHRGFMHSPFFAIVVALLAVVLFFPVEARDFPRRGLRLWVFFSLVTASHGILDAMTYSFMGHGIAFLAPFDGQRFFFPFDLFPTPPVSVSGFFTKWGARVLWTEVLWIWIPAGLLVLFVEVRRWRVRVQGSL